MEISKGIEIVDLCVYMGESLIIADIHMGYEEYLNAKGVLMPRSQFNDTIKRLDRIFRALKGRKISQIILNGDVKHEFGKISDTEWRDTLGLIDYLLNKCKKLILLKGNHDTVLGPIAGKRGVEVKEKAVVGDAYVCHGDAIPEDDEFREAKTIIIGHEHPALGLREKGRIEKFKCFLKGKYGKKELIVMPSFNTIIEGSDVLSEEKLSPFLSNIGNFEAYVVSDEGDTLYFGKVSELSE